MASEPRRWKAFLRLKGETLADKDEDIINEFSAFVQTLKRVGVEYSILVNVESGRATQTPGWTRQFHSIAPATTTRRKPAREFGG